MAIRYMRLERACDAASAGARAASDSGPWSWAGASSEMMESYLKEFDRTVPTWIASIAATLVKTHVMAAVFTAVRVSTSWRIWVCFMLSFWMEQNPFPRTDVTVTRIHTETERRADAGAYRGRLLLFSIVSFGVLWVMQIQHSLATWYEVLLAFTCASSIKLYIELRRISNDSWRALRWATRISLAATCHVTFSCIAVSRLASVDSRGQEWWWLLMEFLVYAVGRYAVRFGVAYLMIGTVMQHPYVIRRYYTIVTDLGLLTGLYCLGDLEQILALACVLVMVDGAVVSLLSKDTLPMRIVHDNTSVLWLHMLSITLALPIDLVRGGLFVWYQRLLVCLFSACATMLVQLATCARFDVPIHSLIPTNTKSVVLPIERHGEWALQIGSTAFAIIGTLYATQVVHRQ